MNYGENIYQLRKEADISQEALAAAIGTTRQQVSRWECGSAVPSAKYVYALADYFHCPVSKILGEETPNDEKEWGRVSDLPNQFRDFARLLALISVISFFVMAFSSTFAGVQAKALYVLSREVDENTRIQINIAVTEMKKQISLFGAYGQSIVSGGLFAALLARFFRYKKLLDNKIDVYEMFTSLYHASVFVFASLIAIWVMMTIGTHGSYFPIEWLNSIPFFIGGWLVSQIICLSVYLIIRAPLGKKWMLNPSRTKEQKILDIILIALGGTVSIAYIVVSSMSIVGFVIYGLIYFPFAAILLVFYYVLRYRPFGKKSN